MHVSTIFGAFPILFSCHAMVDCQVFAKLKGCVVFTSSAAAAAPSPFSVLYAATKAYLASFGAGLAAEVGAEGLQCWL